jgi:hypothetical protein
MQLVIVIVLFYTSLLSSHCSRHSVCVLIAVHRCEILPLPAFALPAAADCTVSPASIQSRCLADPGRPRLVNSQLCSTSA